MVFADPKDASPQQQKRLKLSEKTSKISHKTIVSALQASYGCTGGMQFSRPPKYHFRVLAITNIERI